MIDVLKEISGAVLFDEQILMKFVGKQKLCKVKKTTTNTTIRNNWQISGAV